MSKRVTQKKIEFKTIQLDSDDDKSKLDYKKTLISVLRAPSNPQAGVDYEEAEKRMKLINKIRDAKDFVLLEEAEWNELWIAFKRFKFSQVFSGVVQLGKDIFEAEKVELKEVKKEEA